jgi:hypothetical protein
MQPLRRSNLTKLCLIAGNRHEAETFARSQFLEDYQWFYPKDVNELIFRSNFHVLVVGTAGMNTPPAYFERILQTALTRGKIGRY